MEKTSAPNISPFKAYGMGDVITLQAAVLPLPKFENTLILFIPADTVQAIGGLKTRLLCCINQGEAFAAGFVAFGEGNAYLLLNKSKRLKYALEIGMEVNLQLRPHPDELGMPLPEVLAEILAQDEEAFRRYRGLAPGKQRYLAYDVAKLKSPDKQIERALHLMRNLKSCTEGKESFEALLRK